MRKFQSFAHNQTEVRFFISEQRADLEVDVGAITEGISELRIFDNILPLSGPMLLNAGEQRLLLLLRPFELMVSHLYRVPSSLPSPSSQSVYAIFLFQSKQKVFSFIVCEDLSLNRQSGSFGKFLI